MLARVLSRRTSFVLGGVAAAAWWEERRTAKCQTFAVHPSLAAEAESDVVVENWSGTHSFSPSAYFQPESPDAVQRILDLMHEVGGRLRVVGSALSPNGIGLSDEPMLNMAMCGSVLKVDKEKKQVTVQAGARVSEVVEAIRPHGLTLQNYASIAEQQIGGFLQVGAHGTGAGVPPVDEQVVRMVLHTPALGALELSERQNPRLFYLAKVGLGWLGVVSEVTIQCVDAHKLVQHTYVETRQGVERTHLDNLKHQHMRYMWIPNTDSVVVVTLDPVPEGFEPPAASPGGSSLSKPSEVEATRPLRELLLTTSKSLSGKAYTRKEAEGMNFAQLRDALLSLAPLDKQHVISVNQAEAEYWKSAQGFRVDWSDKLLGFECGGQQWVSEVAFPCGTLSKPDKADLRYMSELLDKIEASDLPTPAPIEQRWTRRSRAKMSPAYSEGADDLHCWVGIIMYLPTDEPKQRKAITDRFWEYNGLCRRELWPKYGCHQHWAKIEHPDSAEELEVVRSRLAERFPLQELNAVKKQLDPKGVLGNELIDTLLLPREEMLLKRLKGAGAATAA